ncbi:unnamed protein product [Amoebophrya sp. A120]|nr:unnamed protein product [Amoebophrya sp. A120]|eukprot:GSA120T00003737001.1
MSISQFLANPGLFVKEREKREDGRLPKEIRCSIRGAVVQRFYDGEFEPVEEDADRKNSKTQPKKSKKKPEDCAEDEEEPVENTGEVSKEYGTRIFYLKYKHLRKNAKNEEYVLKTTSSIRPYLRELADADFTDVPASIKTKLERFRCYLQHGRPNLDKVSGQDEETSTSDSSSDDSPPSPKLCYRTKVASSSSYFSHITEKAQKKEPLLPQFCFAEGQSEKKSWKTAKAFHNEISTPEGTLEMQVVIKQDAEYRSEEVYLKKSSVNTVFAELQEQVFGNFQTYVDKTVSLLAEIPKEAGTYYSNRKEFSNQFLKTQYFEPPSNNSVEDEGDGEAEERALDTGFKIPSNKRDEEAPKPKKWTKSKELQLRKEQLQAISWMLKRERVPETVTVKQKKFVEQKQLSSEDDSGFFLNISTNPIGNTIQKAPWGLELEASYNFAVHGGILADRPGEGKTVTTIGLMAAQKDYFDANKKALPTIPDKDVPYYFNLPKTTLILVPSRLINQWADEVQKFASQYKLRTYLIKHAGHLSGMSPAELKEFDLIVCTYQLLYSEKFGKRAGDWLQLDDKDEHADKIGAQKAYSHQALKRVTKTFIEEWDTADQATRQRYTNSTIFKESTALTAKEIKENCHATALRNKKHTSMDVVFPLLEQCFFQRIIYDEIHEAETFKGRTATLMALRAHFKWGLTGTPYVESFQSVKTLAGLFSVDVMAGGVSGEWCAPEGPIEIKPGKKKPQNPNDDVGLPRNRNAPFRPPCVSSVLLANGREFVKKLMRQNKTSAAVKAIKMEYHSVQVQPTDAEQLLYSETLKKYKAEGIDFSRSLQHSDLLKVQDLVKLCSHHCPDGDGTVASEMVKKWKTSKKELKAAIENAKTFLRRVDLCRRAIAYYGNKGQKKTQYFSGMAASRGVQAAFEDIASCTAIVATTTTSKKSKGKTNSTSSKVTAAVQTGGSSSSSGAAIAAAGGDESHKDTKPSDDASKVKIMKAPFYNLSESKLRSVMTQTVDETELPLKVDVAVEVASGSSSSSLKRSAKATGKHVEAAAKRGRAANGKAKPENVGKKSAKNAVDEVTTSVENSVTLFLLPKIREKMKQLIGCDESSAAGEELRKFIQRSCPKQVGFNPDTSKQRNTLLGDAFPDFQRAEDEEQSESDDDSDSSWRDTDARKQYLLFRESIDPAKALARYESDELAQEDPLKKEEPKSKENETKILDTSDGFRVGSIFREQFANPDRVVTGKVTSSEPFFDWVKIEETGAKNTSTASSSSSGAAPSKAINTSTSLGLDRVPSPQKKVVTTSSVTADRKETAGQRANLKLKLERYYRDTLQEEVLAALSAVQDKARAHAFLSTAKAVFGYEEDCPACVHCEEATVDQGLGVMQCGHVICKNCATTKVRKCDECGRNVPKWEPPHVYFADPKPALAGLQPNLLSSYVPVPNMIVPASFTEFGSKIKQICNTLRDIKQRETDAKAIVYCQWPDLSKKLAAAFKAYSFKFRNLNAGNANVQTAFQNDEPFEESESPEILVMNLQKAASGTNLHRASHLLLVHPMVADTAKQSRAFEKQAIGRIRRYGQKRTCHIYRFYTMDTIEHELHDRVLENQGDDDDEENSEESEGELDDPMDVDQEGV